MSKHNLKFKAAILVVLAIAFGLPFAEKSLAQQSTNNDQVHKELNLGATAYLEDDYKQAEEHFRIAKTLDPKNKIAPLFYAQAIYAQVSKPIKVVLLPEPVRPSGQKTTQPVLSEQEISVTTQRALDAFKEALQVDPKNPDIYSYIAHIYGQLGDSEQQEKWLLAKAELPDLGTVRKCEVYYNLAVIKWEQSYPITAKWTDTRKGTSRESSLMYHIYLRSDFPAEERARAEQYTSEGISYLNKALAMDPDYANAYSYLALLHREQAKLARTAAARMRFINEYRNAMAEFVRLNRKLEKSQRAGSSQE